MVKGTLRENRVVFILVAVAALGVVANFSCIQPMAMKQAWHPREGRALGGRVAVVYSKHYQIELGGKEKLHSFDINKYAKIYLRLAADRVITSQDIFVPHPVTREQILMVHSPEFLESLKNSECVAGYLEAPVVKTVPAKLIDACILKAFRHATGGTIAAGRLAIRYGVAINIAGGYHHAMPDVGEGFCIYNDLAIAVRVLQKEGLIRRAAVIDLDVHQGNGTAVCFAGDDSVFTFSMHQDDIYPIPKETSDLDVELPAGTGDTQYLEMLAEHLSDVLDRARPDIVFLQAGCDTLRGDPLANMYMTLDGIVRRDAMVIDMCAKRKIPVVMTLGGGYSPKAWSVQYASIRRTIEKHSKADALIKHKRIGE